MGKISHGSLVMRLLRIDQLPVVLWRSCCQRYIGESETLQRSEKRSPGASIALTTESLESVRILSSDGRIPGFK